MEESRLGLTNATKRPLSDDAFDECESREACDYPRKRVSVACEVCRLRKTRCDALRPACSFCVQSGATCEYRRTVVTSARLADNEKARSTESCGPEVLARLARIENLLEDWRTQRDDTEAQPRPLKPGLRPLDHETGGLDHSPSKEQHNHEIATANVIVGHPFKGLGQLDANAIPAALLPLAQDDGEQYLELELARSGDILGPDSVDDQGLDLSSKTCWRLQQAFSRTILPWCPFIDQEECARVVSQACGHNFTPRDHYTCFALLILALGSMTTSSSDQKDCTSFSGVQYFRLAAKMIASTFHLNYSIVAVQCKVLMAFYLLFYLRPLQAFDVLHQASLSILGLLQQRAKLASNPLFREQVHRAYWACYLFEHELQANVAYSSCLLQQQNENVPLPLFDDDEPGGYWFLSEIALRKIFANSRESSGWSMSSLHKSAVIQELITQLDQWYDYLPSRIKFPLSLSPLIDSHKVFLRAQYFALGAVLHWQAVVRLLTAPPSGEQEYYALIEEATKSLSSCVLHVHAVESLLHERHLMLSANIAGLHCITYLLLCTYDVPALADVQQPKQDEAIWKARNLLANWTNDSVINVHVSHIDEVMMSKGLMNRRNEQSSSPGGPCSVGSH